MQKRPVIFITTLSVAIVSFGLFMIAVWQGWFGPSTGVGAVFCEASHPGLIKQPSNTWSNLGFITAGLIMAWQLSGTKFKTSNSLTNSVFYATFFSCLGVLLGPGSMAMHATETSFGGFFDMLSMYLIASFTLAYAMQRFFNWEPIQFVAIFVATLVICLWANFQPFHIVFHFFGNAAFAFFITLTVIFEMLNMYYRKLQHKALWGWSSLASILLALTIWNLSKNGSALCDPYSVIQGHAIWHLLGAYSVYGLFRFYVSEHRP